MSGPQARLPRRELLAAAALAPLAAAVPSTAHGRVRIGVNRGTWAPFTRAVPDAGVVRVWYNTVNAIPQRWPARAMLPGGAPAPVVLSIRPWPPDLFRGRLDAALEDLVTSAPRGSFLNAWHEAGGNNPLGYPPEVNHPAVMRNVHQYVHACCGGSNVRYGPVTCGPAAQLAAGGWIPGGMDFYGTDWYDNSRYWRRDGTIDPARVEERCASNLDTWRRVSGQRYPVWLIGESNSSRDCHRLTWFGLQAQFLSEHAGHALCTAWFNRPGGLSGTWPPSAATRRGLGRLARVYQ